MSYFYSHLINLEPMITKLDEMDLTSEQKHHLAKLLDSLIHHTVLDQILSSLSGEDKKIFLTMFYQDPHHPQMMDFLSLKIENFHGLIIETIEKLHREFIADIEEAKRKTEL